MNVLIDTHYVLWCLVSPEKLSKEELIFLSDPKNIIYVSVVSLWEINLKYSSGKLNIAGVGIDQLLPSIEKTGFEIIDLNKEEASTFHKLPKIENNDPFDRMLGWQSIRRGLIFMSRDKKIKNYEKYGLKVWKEDYRFSLNANSIFWAN